MRRSYALLGLVVALAACRGIIGIEDQKVETPNTQVDAGIDAGVDSAMATTGDDESDAGIDASPAIDGNTTPPSCVSADASACIECCNGNTTNTGTPLYAFVHDAILQPDAGGCSGMPFCGAAGACTDACTDSICHSPPSMNMPGAECAECIVANSKTSCTQAGALCAADTSCGSAFATCVATCP